MKYLVLIFTAFVLNVIADTILPQPMHMDGIANAVYADCQAYGEEAEAVQMIRQDGNTLDQVISGLAAEISANYEEGWKNQPIFLVQVHEIGRYVYAFFPAEWPPVMVGTTYRQECMEKTMGQLNRLPKFQNGLADQSERAIINQ